MTYTVYGIRLKGEREVRYIGHTKLDLSVRLRHHLSAEIRSFENRPLLPWIRANRNKVEMFAIAKCASESEARVTESVLISLCIRLNQRLLNSAQVPPRLRAAA